MISGMKAPTTPAVDERTAESISVFFRPGGDCESPLVMLIIIAYEMVMLVVVMMMVIIITHETVMLVVAMVMLIIIPYETVMLVVVMMMVTTVEFLMTLIIRIINEVCTKIMR